MILSQQPTSELAHEALLRAGLKRESREGEVMNLNSLADLTIRIHFLPTCIIGSFELRNLWTRR